ncbi:MAG: phospholipase D-like domain-containing protein [Minisyncoccia bacterium]
MHTDWQFFLRAEDAWESMFNTAREAKKEILCEQYVLSNDKVGQEFLDILIERAKAGVDVQMIIDMVGATISGFYFDNDVIKKIEKAGIKLIFWNPIKPWRLDTIFSWFFRDHRKLMIVDEHIGFIGGVGLRQDMSEWRDTHLKVVGPVVEEMRHAFFEMWALANEKKFFRRLRKRKHFARGFEFVTNSPSINRRFIYDALAYEFSLAKERILITTPYFIPDRKMSRLLRLASSKGVNVEILVPKHSNHPWVDMASRRTFKKLIEAGVKIHRYSDSMLHAKTFVVDDRFASIGSFNFDSLSFNLNYEANVVSHQSLFIDQVAAYFEEDKNGTELVSENVWKNRSPKEKFLEIFATLIRKFL